MATQTAMFGAGCFWGVEARYREVPGVLDAAVGYAGGDVDNPGYREVCSGATGHAEVVWLKFDDEVVSYQQLLDHFFEWHNPTTLNRQGPDVGTQYRSVVFAANGAQAEAARETIARLDAAGRFPNPIVTQVEDDAPFWRAEEYHQRYLEKNGRGFCGI